MSSSPSPIRFYRSARLLNCHRVEPMLSMLGPPFKAIELDIPRGDLCRPEFLALNRFGEVPVIADGYAVVADSTAILVYLAGRYGGAQWLPDDPLGSARVQRWLSAASGPMAHALGHSRQARARGLPPFLAGETVIASHTLLHALEDELAGRPFLAGPHATIADLACYADVARAPKGAVPLDLYPNLRDWLGRIEALPGFVPAPVRPPVAVRPPTKGVGAWLRRRRQ